MSDSVLVVVVVGLIVQIIFGSACFVLADRGKTTHPFAWFVVGLCLGPLGLAFSLISSHPSEYRTNRIGTARPADPDQ